MYQSLKIVSIVPFWDGLRLLELLCSGLGLTLLCSEGLPWDDSGAAALLISFLFSRRLPFVRLFQLRLLSA